MAPTKHHLLLALLLAAGACSDDGDDQTRPAWSGKKLVLISVDGLRPDAIDLAPAPTIKALAMRGSYTWEAQTVRPSITLPSHTSMITGTSIAEHRITWNDHRPGHVEKDTALAAARRAGARTILVSGKEKFFTLAPPNTVDVFVWASGGDQDVAASAAPELQRGFGLAMIHFPGVDDMGHAMQWMSPAWLAQVRTADAAVKTVLDVLPSDTIVILTADHGGQGLNHAENIAENTTIPWIAAGPGIRPGHELKFDIWTTDTAATIARFLGVSLAGGIGRPVLEAQEGFSGTVESCGTIANDGEVVVETVAAEPAPAPAGGTPAPGRYRMTSSTVYVGENTMVPLQVRRFKAAIEVTAGSGGAVLMDTVESPVGQSFGPMGLVLVAGKERRSRFQTTVSGSKLQRQRLCSRTIEPGAPPLSDDFTASGDEIWIHGTLASRGVNFPVVAKYTRVQ